MAPPQEFYRSLSKRSTTSIIDALASARDYDPEAIRAFEEELRRRGVPADSLAEQVTASIAWQKPKNQRAEEALEWPVRMVCLFLIVPIFLYWDYQSKGFTRKAHESLRWGFFGIGAYLLFAISLRLSALF